MDISALIYALLVKPIVALFVFLGIDPTHLAAGVLGAAVKALVDKTRSKLEIATTMFIGGVCASYLTPIVNVWVQPGNIEANNGMAFVIGTIGVSLTQYALKVSANYASSNKLPKVIDQFNPAENSDNKPSD